MKTTNLTKTLICILSMALTFSIQAASKAQGTNSGGGGGVYKIKEGKYLTLPEVGILIGNEKTAAGKKFEKLYTITEETKIELRVILAKINSVLPGQELTEELVVGERGAFVVLENIESSKYQQIKTEYEKVMNSYGYALDDNKFVLPAYSTRGQKDVKGKTYILPDFLLMNNYQQAMILIHEYNMRKENVNLNNRANALRIALSVDSQLYLLLNDSPGFNLMSALKKFISASLLDQQNVLKIVLKKMQEEINLPLKTTDLFAEGPKGDILSEKNEVLQINPSIVQEIQERHSTSLNYAEALEGAVFEVHWYSYRTYFRAEIEEILEVCGLGRNVLSIPALSTCEGSSSFDAHNASGYAYKLKKLPYFFK